MMERKDDRGPEERDSLGEWLGSSRDQYRHQEWNSDRRTTTNPVVRPADRSHLPTALTPFERDVYDVVKGLAELLIKKHKDYGPLNVANAPGGPLNGLRVRIHDKTARINNLLDKGVSPENESLRDSFADLANYAIISLLVLDDKWPTK